MVPIHQGLLVSHWSGCTSRLRKAVEWFESAALHGHLLSQLMLGTLHLYESDPGVPSDYAKAFYWAQKVASQGYALAQIMIGNIYFKGH